MLLLASQLQKPMLPPFLQSQQSSARERKVWPCHLLWKSTEWIMLKLWNTLASKKKRDQTKSQNLNYHACLKTKDFSVNYKSLKMNGVLKLTTKLINQQLSIASLSPLKAHLLSFLVLKTQIKLQTSSYMFTRVTKLRWNNWLKIKTEF